MHRTRVIAQNERSAARIASRIMEEWTNSGSASIDLMMGWSKKAMEEQKFDIALDFLDQVVAMRPDYAEGWNRRATVHFMMQNYAKSMADIEQTLELEPRHFGAIAGMAQIFKARGNKQMAFDAYQRVLEIYPMMRNAQNGQVQVYLMVVVVSVTIWLLLTALPMILTLV